VTDLLAVIASATSETDTADDRNNDADSEQNDDSQEEAEMCFPDGLSGLWHWLLVNALWGGRNWLDDDRKTHLHVRSTHQRANRSTVLFRFSYSVCNALRDLDLLIVS